MFLKCTLGRQLSNLIKVVVAMLQITRKEYLSVSFRLFLKGKTGKIRMKIVKKRRELTSLTRVMFLTFSGLFKGRLLVQDLPKGW